jgi:hypothetical protein
LHFFHSSSNSIIIFIRHQLRALGLVLDMGKGYPPGKRVGVLRVRIRIHVFVPMTIPIPIPAEPVTT